MILIANVFFSPEPAGSDFHVVFFPLALVAGGFLFTSTLFAELPDKPRAHAYLTLPISTIERWAVRVLLSTVGYVAVALAGYFLVTLLGAGSASSFADGRTPSSRRRWTIGVLCWGTW